MRAITTQQEVETEMTARCVPLKTAAINSAGCNKKQTTPGPGWSPVEWPPAKWILGAALLLGAAQAPAREVLTSSSGAFDNRGTIGYQAIAPLSQHFSCPTSATSTKVGFAFDVYITLEPGAPDYTQSCSGSVQMSFGVLTPGTYTVTTHYTGADTKESRLTFTIDDALKICSSDPLHTEIYVVHPTKNAAALEAEMRDPAKRAALGDPLSVRSVSTQYSPNAAYLKYAAPRNLRPVADMLRDMQGFTYASWNSVEICFSSMPSIAADVIEFYHPKLNHYFYTPVDAEIAYIESGGAGPGWGRTGEKFRAMLFDGNCGGTGWLDSEYGQPMQRTYRFYGTPGKGPNSHFFSGSASECYAVTQDPGWQYEASTFMAQPLQAGGKCAKWGTPLYRVYNNRHASNDANHRYTTKQTVVDEMVAKGWVSEGAVMCVMAPDS